MSYEPGKLGMAEGIALVLLSTLPPLVLSYWSMLIELTATAAWLVAILNSLIFIILFMALLFVMQRFPGDLHSATEQLLGVWGARVITTYLFICFFAETVLMLREFSEHTLLTALPGMNISFVIAWYALWTAIAIYIGMEPLARAALFATPFVISGVILICLLLLNKFDLYNLSPWTGYDLPVILQTGIMSTGAHLCAYVLPIMASSFPTITVIRRAAILGFGLSTFVRVTTLFVYIGVFSAVVGREKVLPFFEMTRLVYINRFVQRVDSLYIILWVVLGIAAIAISLYIAVHLLTRLFNLPSPRPLAFPLAFIGAQLALFPPNVVATIGLTVTATKTIYTFGVFLIPVILVVACLIKGKGHLYRAA